MLLIYLVSVARSRFPVSLRPYHLQSVSIPLSGIVNKFYFLTVGAAGKLPAAPREVLGYSDLHCCFARDEQIFQCLRYPEPAIHHAYVFIRRRKRRVHRGSDLEGSIGFDVRNHQLAAEPEVGRPFSGFCGLAQLGVVQPGEHTDEEHGVASCPSRSTKSGVPKSGRKSGSANAR